MPSEIVLQLTPDAAALLEKRAQMAGARTALALREAELVKLRAQFKTFEVRYLEVAGILYVELDEIEARIAEREVDLYDSESARRRAQKARRRAQETRDAAHEQDEEPEEFDPPPSLKTLFREVAKRIHPDFAADDAERQHFTLLMARANHAYSRGDTDTLQRMLDDQHEIRAANAFESTGVEVLRMTRQIGHVKRDLAALDAEELLMMESELGQLYTDAAAATEAGRDLVVELADDLRAQIAEAQGRFALIDRQIAAHGR